MNQPRQSGGIGPHVITLYREHCNRCNGRGQVMTDAGKAVAELVTHVRNDGR